MPVDERALTAVLLGGAAVLTLIVALLVLWLRRRRSRVPAGEVPRGSWSRALTKTRGNLASRLIEAWEGPGQRAVWLAEAEEILLTADVGVKGTGRLLEILGRRLDGIESTGELRAVLERSVRSMFDERDGEVEARAKPWVILVVGVNGVGKTTTIGKLAHRYRERGMRVLLVAADTFRAAAIEQLSRWAERVGVGVVKHQHGADPSAVAFDGMKAAEARDVDVVIVDTAGRLHVKENLMDELRKVARTISRQIAGAPHEILLVVDATTGQNALSQARVFHEALGVTGVALTKLDGTAKGGIALAVRGDIGLPIRFVGLGERPEDLRAFDPAAFAAALFSADESDERPLEEIAGPV